MTYLLVGLLGSFIALCLGIACSTREPKWWETDGEVKPPALGHAGKGWWGSGR